MYCSTVSVVESQPALKLIPRATAAVEATITASSPCQKTPHACSCCCSGSRSSSGTWKTGQTQSQQSASSTSTRSASSTSSTRYSTSPSYGTFNHIFGRMSQGRQAVQQLLWLLAMLLLISSHTACAQDVYTMQGTLTALDVTTSGISGGDRQYFLTTDRGHMMQLTGAGTASLAGLTTSSRVRVKTSQKYDPSSSKGLLEIISATALEASAQLVPDDDMYLRRRRTIYDMSSIYILVEFDCGAGGTGTKPAATVEEFDAHFWQGKVNMTGYIETCSYGKAPFQPKYTKTLSVKLPCKGTTHASGQAWDSHSCDPANLILIGQEADWYMENVLQFNHKRYRHHILIMPEDRNCGWSGTAVIGMAMGSWSYVWIDGGHWQDYQLYLHEVGHNWNLGHSATATGCDTCDFSSAMGYCCNQRCYHAPHNWQMGWASALSSHSAKTLPPGTDRILTLPSQVTTDQNFVVVQTDWSDEPHAFFISYRKTTAPYDTPLGTSDTSLDGVLVHQFDGGIQVGDSTSYLMAVLSTSRKGSTSWIDVGGLMGGMGSGLVVRLVEAAETSCTVALCRLMSSTEDSLAACTDGRDNDCNGVADEDEPQCAPFLEAIRKLKTPPKAQGQLPPPTLPRPPPMEPSDPPGSPPRLRYRPPSPQTESPPTPHPAPLQLGPSSDAQQPITPPPLYPSTYPPAAPPPMYPGAVYPGAMYPPPAYSAPSYPATPYPPVQGQSPPHSPKAPPEPMESPQPSLRSPPHVLPPRPPPKVRPSPPRTGRSPPKVVNHRSLRTEVLSRVHPGSAPGHGSVIREGEQVPQHQHLISLLQPSTPNPSDHVPAEASNHGAVLSEESGAHASPTLSSLAHHLVDVLHYWIPFTHASGQKSTPLEATSLTPNDGIFSSSSSSSSSPTATASATAVSAATRGPASVATSIHSTDHTTGTATDMPLTMKLQEQQYTGDTLQKKGTQEDGEDVGTPINVAWSDDVETGEADLHYGGEDILNDQSRDMDGMGQNYRDEDLLYGLDPYNNLDHDEEAAANEDELGSEVDQPMPVSSQDGALGSEVDQPMPGSSQDGALGEGEHISELLPHVTAITAIPELHVQAEETGQNAAAPNLMWRWPNLLESSTHTPVSRMGKLGPAQLELPSEENSGA